MKTYVIVYFGAALVAMFAMPLVVYLARTIGLMDEPGLRKVHQKAVARVGGIAIAAGFFALTVPVLLLDNSIGEAVRDVQAELLALMVGAALMFLVGIIDDVRGLRGRLKLLALLAASALLCAAGSRVHDIAVGTLVHIELGVWAWPFTIVWIVTLTVGINFIDGLDGLAGGVAAIVCGAIAVFALVNGQIVMVVLMLALLGSLTGFLFFNYHPAKVFMGDGGSMFIGFTIAGGSVLCQAKTSTFVGIALPILALGVPLLDIFFSMIRRRVIDRRSIFMADKGHLHHRLLAKGLNHQTAVFVVYGITFVSAGIGLSTLATDGKWTIAVFVGGVAFLLVTFCYLGSTRLRETFAAWRRNRIIAKETRTEKEFFGDTQLRLREAVSFTDWWPAVCELASSMEFRSLALWRRDEGPQAGRLFWRKSEPDAEDETWADVSLPVVRGPVNGLWQLKVCISVNGSLEAVGRRIGLLARLIDEYPPPVGEGHIYLCDLESSQIDVPAGMPLIDQDADDGGVAPAN